MWIYVPQTAAPEAECNIGGFASGVGMLETATSLALEHFGIKGTTLCACEWECTTAATPAWPRTPATFPSSLPTDPTTRLGLLLSVWTPPVPPRLNPAFQWFLMGWPSPTLIFCGWEVTASSPCKPPLQSTNCYAAWLNQTRAELKRLMESGRRSRRSWQPWWSRPGPRSLSNSPGDQT